MKWIFSRTQLLFAAAFLVAFVAAHTYSRSNEGLADGPGADTLASQSPAVTGDARSASAHAERVFVVAKRAPDAALPGDSLILVCERGGAAENAVHLLERRGYSRVDIMPGAAAAVAESHARRETQRLADGCTQWRPFAL